MLLPSLPDEQSLDSLASYLRSEDYRALQFIPFQEHGELFKANHLHILLKDEERCIRNLGAGIPILYESTLSIGYYKRKANLTTQQQLLQAVFLLGSSLERSDLALLPQAIQKIVLEHSTPNNNGSYRFNLRVAPVGEHLFIADHLNSAHDESIFLFHDSTVLYNYINQHCDFSGKSVVDLGAGSGIQSLICASRNAREVITVDINERASDFVQANFELNKQPLSPRFIQQSMLEYEYDADVIVSNPPYMYRPAGDRVCEQGGCAYGLEHVVHIHEQCRSLRKELIMIFSAPAKDGVDHFSELTGHSNDLIHISSHPLVPGIKTHDFLLSEGFTSRELFILHADNA